MESSKLECQFIGVVTLVQHICQQIQCFMLEQKHIEVNFHFVYEIVAQKALEIKFVSSQDQLADGLTEPLGLQQLKTLRHNLNLLTCD